MKIDGEDLDWGLGELLHLFCLAGRIGRYPHELDPGLFHSAWTVLNAQPFDVRMTCRSIVLNAWAEGWAARRRFGSGKRYENALVH